MNRNEVIDKVFREDGYKIIFAIRKAGCPEQDVEDVLHQTIVTALEKFDQLKDPSKATAWCVRIALNITYRNFEKGKRNVIVDFTSEEETSKLEEKTAFHVNRDEISNAELRMDLKKLMGKVSPEYTIPLQMKTIYGFSYDEIAEMMGIHPGTVKTRINRCKRMLEKFIALDRNREKNV